MFEKTLRKYKKRYEHLDKDIIEFNERLNGIIIKGHEDDKRAFNEYTLTGLVSRYFAQGASTDVKNKLIPFLLIAMLDYKENPNELLVTETSQNDTQPPIYYITLGFFKNPILVCHLAAILIENGATVSDDIYNLLDTSYTPPTTHKKVCEKVLEYIDILNKNNEVLKKYRNFRPVFFSNFEN